MLIEISLSAEICLLFAESILTHKIIIIKIVFTCFLTVFPIIVFVVIVVIYKSLEIFQLS